MSNAVFPVLAGLAYNIARSPVWSTQVSDSASGRQYALSKRLYPTWHFKLPFAVLRASGGWTEWQTLVGFINARRGRYDDFLYQDPRDCQATGQQFGVGDATTRSFQLVRSLGGFAEPVGGVNTGTVTVFVNGTPTAVTYDATLSIVSFGAAPAAGAVLTWTGQFYFRCRFLQDEISMEQFMQDMYTASSVEFKTFRP